MMVWVFALYILAANGVTVPGWVFFASWLMAWFKGLGWFVGKAGEYVKVHDDIKRQ